MRQILVVDDEAAIREVLMEFLTDHGYEPHGAESGPQALSLVKSIRPPFGRTRPTTIRKVVVFPAPLRPRSPTTSPDSTWIETSSTTLRLP